MGRVHSGVCLLFCDRSWFSLGFKVRSILFAGFDLCLSDGQNWQSHPGNDRTLSNLFATVMIQFFSCFKEAPTFI